MARARPESSPHFNGRLVEPKSVNLGRGKRRRMAGPGFFDETDQPQLDTVLHAELPIIQGSIEVKRERKPMFKRGTVLYVVKIDGDGRVIIPRNRRQAEDFERETLEFDTPLRIDKKEGIELGKTGREKIKVVGKSQYGAFTVVYLDREDRQGKIISELRLASLTQRALPKNNVSLRFKEMNR